MSEPATPPPDEHGVTRAGVTGARPGRLATPLSLRDPAPDGGPGARPGQRPEPRSGTRTDGPSGGRPGAPTGAGGVVAGAERRRGAESVVPRAEFTSYYGRAVIKAPAWQARDIAGYFFLGGLAGAGSLLAAGAQATGRRRMARAMKVSSLTAVSLSAAALVHDLGRPERFANMLRVFKPTSPMSVGSWLLAGYGPAAGVAALSAVSGRLPRLGATATAGAALLGPCVATYTAVLAADTAVPAWHDAYRELPYLFAASATAAAAGMALATAPLAENAPARGASLLGAAADLAVTGAIHHRLGMVAETYRHGRAGRLMRAARWLTAAGAATALAHGHRSRPAAAAAGLALLAGSACTRFGVFHAGTASARDPKYTLVPQRDRLRRRAAGAVP
jgi:DMSO reductase anchor subunit